jgi:EAL and modified HD-GYP domain-containing signal transduction protein
MSITSTLLASQPIYDRDNKLYAVELLYRNDLSQSAMDVGDMAATSELLYNLCTGITEQTDHYHRPAFINVSGDFLLSNRFLPIDPDRVVVELVERMEPTQALISAVESWYRQGFRFAFDDFEFLPSWNPLHKFASVIKVDVLNQDYLEIAEKVAQLSDLDCLWLAERVEDEGVRSHYYDLGFDLFQGYFFAKPKMVYGTKLTPSALQLARLLGALFTEEPDIHDLVAIISSDPNLTVSLLKIVNSPVYRTSKSIRSVKEVIIRLGLNNLRRWVALISALKASSPEAARIVLVRAQMCRELASRSKVSSAAPDHAFLVGLLSGVDVFLGVEKTTFLAQLNLDGPVRNALANFKGPLGRNLKLAIQVESAVLMKEAIESMDLRLLKLYQQANETIQTMIKEM